jgi:hypothetical protein
MLFSNQQTKNTPYTPERFKDNTFTERGSLDTQLRITKRHPRHAVFGGRRYEELGPKQTEPKELSKPS